VKKFCHGAKNGGSRWRHQADEDGPKSRRATVTLASRAFRAHVGVMIRDPRPELSPAELVRVRDSVALVGRLSDSLVRVGPFRLGLDGVLTWIPGVGELYSTAAAAFILVQGVRARVPLPTLATCAVLMGSRTMVSAIPLAGPAVADFFLAHRISAKLVVKAIDAMLPAEDRTPPKTSWLARLGRPRGTVTA
jgi:hypothetical protein